MGRGRNRVGRNAALILPVLFPREEEECLISTVVEFRDPDRTAECAAVVVLLVECPRQTHTVVIPRVRIQVFIPEDVVSHTVKQIATGLGVEAFDSACGPA